MRLPSRSRTTLTLGRERAGARARHRPALDIAIGIDIANDIGLVIDIGIGHRPSSSALTPHFGFPHRGTPRRGKHPGEPT